MRDPLSLFLIAVELCKVEGEVRDGRVFGPEDSFVRLDAVKIVLLGGEEVTESVLARCKI